MIVDRVNRVLLLLIGASALGVGTYAVGRAWGWWSSSEHALLGSGFRDWLDRSESWLPWVALAVAAVLLPLAPLWTVAQFAPLREQDRRLLIRHADGNDEIDLDAAAAMLDEDVQAVPGVVRCKSRIVTVRSTRRLVVELECRARADLAMVRRRVEQDALTRFEHVVGVSEIDTTVAVALSDAGSRVQ